MRIDAHQHYWKVARADYGWLTADKGVLYRDYEPLNLVEHLQQHGISGSIVVQAAPTVAETEYMLQLAEQVPTIVGVVGWLDFASDAFEPAYERLREHPYFVGVRPMIQDLPDGWMLQEQVVKRFARLADEGFPVDLQLRVRLLPDALKLLARVPHLRAVIDHIAKPDMAQGQWEPWAEGISRLSAHEQVMCKLSGMVSEVPGVGWSVEQIRPYFEHVLQAFGPARVMFGSDWPVCLISASYDEVMEALHQLLDNRLGDKELAGLYGGNAARFYRLP